MRILVYLGATTPKNPIYTEAVKALGERIAQRGMTLVFGGSNEGTMTLLADTVKQNGGKIIGIFTEALSPELLYPGMTETYITENIAERKELMLEKADAVIAMPGSFGTWDELFNALEAAKIDKLRHRQAKPIAMLNLDGYYDGILTLLTRSVQDGYTTPRFEKLLYSANSLQELLCWLDSLASANE